MPITYEPIATTTLSSATSTITFSSIPATYTDIKLIISGTVATAGYQYIMTFNNDTAANYSQNVMEGDGSTFYGRSRTNVSNFWISEASLLGGSTTIPTLSIVDIFSYAATRSKVILFSYSNDRNGSGSIGRGAGAYTQGTAITRIDITCGVNMSIGTVATIYGIKAA